MDRFLRSIADELWNGDFQLQFNTDFNMSPTNNTMQLHYSINKSVPCVTRSMSMVCRQKNRQKTNKAHSILLLKTEPH
jgi:hypothetical protein